MMAIVAPEEPTTARSDGATSPTHSATRAAHPGLSSQCLSLRRSSVYFGLTAYPAFRTIFDSFFTIDGPGDTSFAGLQNYRDLWHDEIFGLQFATRSSGRFVAPFLDVATGLLLALALYAGVPFARFFRVAWFTPVLLSYVVVAILWMWIYNYDWGFVNDACERLG